MLLCNIKTLHTCLYQDNSSKSRVMGFLSALIGLADQGSEFNSSI